MDSIFRLTQQVLQFVHGSASSSSPENGKEISDILDDLQSVRRKSAWIKAVLADAEERAVRGEELMKLWLTDLHHLNYRAADLLGLYEYEVVAQQIHDEEASATAAAVAKGKQKLDQVYNSSPLTDPSFLQEFALGIRKFREDFDEINKIKEALRFDKEDGEKNNRRDVDMIERLPTGSEPVDDLFFGREEKLQELIEYLLTDSIEVENDPNSNCVPVIALVGMGGVGKTTLAQHAFNDPRVCELYSKKGWVCVSDNFDVSRVTKLTLETLNEECNHEGFSVLQKCLKDAVKEKNFLLVLDDVWNEKMAPWETFYSSLRAGAKGSKIIITTRSKTVADTAKAMKCIDVSCLSDAHAWAFFQTVVFGGHGTQHELDHPALTDVGKKITERCKGLPLAIKVLGGYLRCHNKDVHIWYEVLESKLLQPPVLGAEANQVLGPLILSYLHLPACVKPCFVLSCVFPKDYGIEKEQLIDLWMAHELIEDGDETTGMLYIENLVARSFFEISSGDMIKIHDVIHDLAMHLSRDKMLHETYGDEIHELLISKEVQHAFVVISLEHEVIPLKFDITDTAGGLRTLYLEGGEMKLEVDPKRVNFNGLRSLRIVECLNVGFLLECLKRLKNLRHLELSITPLVQGRFDTIGTLYNLRTLIVGPEDGIPFPVCISSLRQLIRLRIRGITDAVPDTISKLVNLKEMDLSYSEIICLPESIGNLKALRVLKLEYCESLIKLPASIGELKALEVLKLDRCRFLIKLPASIGELKALEVLSLNECKALEGLPAGIKRLTKLQPLEYFRVAPRESVADGDVLRIEELKELVCIGSKFTIERLENVATQEEAKQSGLDNKSHIRWLALEWSMFRGLPWNDVDERVAKDEQVLQGLRPHANLEGLRICGWKGRTLAPWLGDTSFVNLKKIRMTHIPSCESLTPMHQLPSLQYLSCSTMPSLLYLTPISFRCSDWDTRNSCFPALEQLFFDNCRRLVFLADSMPLLQELHLEYCGTLDSLPSLKKLDIGDCDSLESISFDNLPALEELDAHGCSRLGFSDSTVLPSSIRNLRIDRCPEAVNWCRAHRQSKLAHGDLAFYRGLDVVTWRR